MTTVLAFVHLAVAATWFGSMAYSLVVVQPRVATFFTDAGRREEFLTVLAQGNRWRVVAMIAVLLLSGVGTALAAPGLAAGFGVATGLDALAAVIFVDVSWRHWPARVFAPSEEIPAYQRALRLRARCMLGLVGVAFLVALWSAVT